jgi:hypothetical protein
MPRESSTYGIRKMLSRKGQNIYRKRNTNHFRVPSGLPAASRDDIFRLLKLRMQGKSCFNFKEADKKILGEQSDLTMKSFEFYKKNRML